MSADKLVKISDNVYGFRGHRIEVTRPKGGKHWIVTVTTPKGEVWKSEARGTRDQIARQAAFGIDVFSNPARKRNSPARVRGNRPITRADYPAIFGDFDRDAITDADDPRPRTPGDTESIEEVRLADEMDALLATRAEFVPIEQELRSTLGEMGIRGSKIKTRVKTPFSILNKLRRKRIESLTDIAGGMMIVPDQEALERASKKIEQHFDVIEKLDFYKTPQNGYRAKHYVVRVHGKPVELQLKTERMAQVAKASHTAYKRGVLNVDAMERITRMAWNADRGNKVAAETIDDMIAHPDALRRALTTTGNPSSRAYCELMPEDPWAYFTRPRGTVLMPIDELTPTRAREKGIKNAEKYMRMACQGTHDKRKPITVDPETLKVLDGNSTFAVARSWGWREIPVTFERASNPQTSAANDARVRSLARRLANG